MRSGTGAALWASTTTAISLWTGERPHPSATCSSTFTTSWSWAGRTPSPGSDFDGADIPGYLDSVEKVDNLYDALLADGLGKELAEKILFGNAYNFIRNNLK